MISNRYHFNMSLVSRNTGGRLDKSSNNYKYITRQGIYSDKVDLVTFGNFNIPNQFDSPDDFWKCVDKYERKNANLFVNIRANLPKGLNKKEYVGIVDEFVKDIFSNKTPVSYAIHLKTQSDGSLHPHVHIMFSKREFTKNVPKEQLFKYGVCKKYDGYTNKKYLYFMRECFSYNVNKVLKNKNLDLVTHKSYKTLKKESLEQNNFIDYAYFNMLDRFKKGSYGYEFKNYRNNKNSGDSMNTQSDVEKNRKKRELEMKRRTEEYMNNYNKRKSISNTLSLKERLKELYKKIKKYNKIYEDILKDKELEQSKYKEYAVVSMFLNETPKNYNITLPYYDTKNAIKLNNDVLKYENYKQLHTKINNLNNDFKSLKDSKQNLFDDVKLSDDPTITVDYIINNKDSLQNLFLSLYNTNDLINITLENSFEYTSEIKNRVDVSTNNSDLYLFKRSNFDLKLKLEKETKDLNNNILINNLTFIYSLNKELKEFKQDEKIYNNYSFEKMITSYLTGSGSVFKNDFYKYYSNLSIDKLNTFHIEDNVEIDEKTVVFNYYGEDKLYTKDELINLLKIEQQKLTENNGQGTANAYINKINNLLNTEFTNTKVINNNIYNEIELDRLTEIKECIVTMDTFIKYKDIIENNKNDDFTEKFVKHKVKVMDKINPNEKNRSNFY